MAYVSLCFLHELMSCSRALRQAGGMREATGAGPGQRPSNPPPPPTPATTHTNTHNIIYLARGWTRISNMFSIFSVSSLPQLCNYRVKARVGGVRNVCYREWVMTSPGSVQKEETGVLQETLSPRKEIRT